VLCDIQREEVPGGGGSAFRAIIEADTVRNKHIGFDDCVIH